MRRFNATNVQNGHRFFFGKLQIHSNMRPLRFVCNVSGVICVISCLIRCLRSSILCGFRHEIRQITAEMMQNVRDFEHLLH
jgi:hypothetical protein